MGMGARVTILDSNLFRLRQIDDLFGGRIQTLASNAFNIAAATKDADLSVGSVLHPRRSDPETGHRSHGEDHEARFRHR